MLNSCRPPFGTLRDGDFGLPCPSPAPPSCLNRTTRRLFAGLVALAHVVATGGNERGQTTEVTVAGADAQRAEVVELSPTAPDYFERQVVVSQETFDQRGITGRRTLGTATWKKRPGEPFVPLRISLSHPEGPTFLVAIDNGDNPALALGPAAVEIALRRVDFAFEPGDRLTLLTGNPGRRARSTRPRSSRTGGSRRPRRGRDVGRLDRPAPCEPRCGSLVLGRGNGFGCPSRSGAASGVEATTGQTGRRALCLGRRVTT
jgi:hypothetical protein